MAKLQQSLVLAVLVAFPVPGLPQTDHGTHITHQPRADGHGVASQRRRSGTDPEGGAQPHAYAGADVPHEGHAAQPQPKAAAPRHTPPPLPKLGALPPSGKAREVGFDGRTFMEPGPDRASRCALASRGLLMLDHSEWAACGGKPRGASRTVVVPPRPDHTPMGH